MEADCLRAINELGLEPSVSFLHSSRTEPTTLPSLAYDLMEPYRFLIDSVVMRMFLTNQLGIEDFFFTGDDYTYRFDHDKKVQFLKELRKQFAQEIRYGGQTRTWNTVIPVKVDEFGKHLVEPSRELDFVEPSCELN